MNEDMSQYLGLFLDEAGEQIDLLERDILELEQTPSRDLLNGIFRAAHTLKGSSRAMGFVSMGELTHAMEDIFDCLRQSEITATRELVDALFAGLDALKFMREEICALGTSQFDTSIQTTRLRAALEQLRTPEGVSAPPAASTPPKKTKAASKAKTKPAPMEAIAHNLRLNEPQRMAAQDAREAACMLFGIKVRVAEDCIMKSVRVMMVLQALEHVGSVLTTAPDEEALENEEFESEFEILIATQQEADALRKSILDITEIAAVEIFAWTEPPETEVESVQESAEISCPPPTVEAPIEERKIDAGPEARGKSSGEVQKLAGDKKQAQTVRVDVARLDKLLNLVGELVMDRNRIMQLCSHLQQSYGTNDTVENLHESAAHVGRITGELQEEIMKARMLPIDNVFNRFPRMIRDLAQKLGKEVQFIVEGSETELDRSVIEIIGDPLIHMLRNSVDHGVEMPDEREKAGKPRAGTVRLSARYEENHVVIEIMDDGKGMDPEKLRASAVKKGMMTEEAASRLSDREALNLIFTPGFSTAQVVSDVSGRGVGMDIVLNNLSKLGALMDIESRVGIGSKFTVKMPLTLAIIRGLLVKAHGSVYALPLASVVETIRITPEIVHTINHQEIIMQRGRVLPIIRLRNLFQREEATTPAERALEANADFAITHTRSDEASLYVVIIGNAEKQYGLVVDTLIGEQEVVIKTLGKFLGEIKGISGAAILGDGRVALIIDISGMISVAMEEKGLLYAA